MLSRRSFLRVADKRAQLRSVLCGYMRRMEHETRGRITGVLMGSAPITWSPPVRAVRTAAEEPEMISYLVYGFGHNWDEAIARHNRAHPGFPLSLLE
ncbi:MAG: hypothetical protein AAB853_03075 [Patescibacteria group bacterium]